MPHGNCSGAGNLSGVSLPTAKGACCRFAAGSCFFLTTDGKGDKLNYHWERSDTMGRKLVGILFLAAGVLLALSPAGGRLYGDREPYQVRRLQNAGWCAAAVGVVLLFT